ncbi:hypothetical protein CR513_25502, partial [Mucuna pruriens]
MFLEKFFPASRTTTIRKEICGIREHSRETLHEYWERFNKLCATYLYHQINEHCLTMMDRSMIDVASGGALMDKTSAAARHLISNMASNTQYFGIRGVGQPQMVNERFNKLCATYPHNQISLTTMDQSMIDAASGRALMDKTSAAT